MFVFDQLRSKDLPIRLMVIFILCCMLLLVGKLWNLQVATAADYRSQQGEPVCQGDSPASHARPDS